MCARRQKKKPPANRLPLTTRSSWQTVDTSSRHRWHKMSNLWSKCCCRMLCHPDFRGRTGGLYAAHGAAHGATSWRRFHSEHPHWLWRCFRHEGDQVCSEFNPFNHFSFFKMERFRCSKLTDACVELTGTDECWWILNACRHCWQLSTQAA